MRTWQVQAQILILCIGGMSDGTDDDMGDDYYDLLEAGFTPL